MKSPLLFSHLGISITNYIYHLLVQYNILSSKKPKISQLSGLNIGSLTTINIIYPRVADGQHNTLARLSPLGPKQDIRGRRVENVGAWLLQTEKLRS